MVKYLFSNKNKTLSHFALLIALFSIATMLIGTRVFFVSDVGLRYLQVINLINQDWRTLAIDYPGAFIDDELQHVPYYYAYSVIDNQIYLNISPFLPLIASILYRSIGYIGLAFVPVFGGVMTGWGGKEIFKLHNLPFPNLMLWLSILATPILFYSLQLWDHTLAIAFSTWAIYFLIRGIKFQQQLSYLISGILLGFGMGQRPELYAFTLAVGVSLLIVNKLRVSTGVFILGGIVGMLPICILQTLWFGHPLGAMIGGELLGYGRPESYPFSPAHRVDLPRYTKIGLFLYQIDQSRPIITVLILLLYAIGLFLLVYGFRKRQNLSTIYIGLLLFTGSYVITMIAYWGRPIQGLLPTLPLIPLCLVLIPEKQASDDMFWHGYRLIGLVVAVFLIIMLFMWPSDGGLQWGARYLLPIYPLLFFMAIYSLDHLHRNPVPGLKKATQITGITLLGLCISLQIMGVHTLQRALSNQAAIRDEISKLPAEIILTNAPYFQSNMASLDKTFLYIDNTAILGSVLERLARNGIHQVAVIPLAEIDLPVPSQLPGYTVDQMSDFVYRLYQE